MTRIIQTAPGPTTGGGGTPGGANTEVQFNDSGAFGAEAEFAYDKNNDHLTVPGLTVAQDMLVTTAITPAQITATQNDYAPTGFATCMVMRLTSDAQRDITGLAGGVAGRIVLLMNTGGFGIRLLNGSGASSAANRFDLWNDLTIPKDNGVLLYYDGNDSRWRAFCIFPFTYNSTTDTITVGNLSVTTSETVGQDLTVVRHSILGTGGAGGTGQVFIGSPVFTFGVWNTPAQITSNQNNYNPTQASIQRLSSDASRNITGWVAAASDDDFIILWNVGSFNIVLKDEDAASTDVNRFALSGDITLAPDTMTIIVYDQAGERWRALSIGGGGAPTSPAGSDTQIQYNASGSFGAEAALAYDYTNNQLTAPGITGTEDFILSGVISPTALTGDVNDYSPTGLSTASVIRLDADAARTITGLAGGASGRILILHNIGAFTITLADDSGSSSAANRFDINGAMKLRTDMSAILFYDGTGSRWRVLNQGVTDTENVTWTGNHAFEGKVQFSGIVTPTQITADQNDYSPTGIATCNALRLSTDASRNITGLTDGGFGRLIFIHNIGSFNIVLVDESGSSTAANRFALNANVTILPDQTVLLWYDGNTSRWRVLYPGSGTATPPAGSDTHVQYNASGSFGGEAAFAYDYTNNQLTVPGLTLTEDAALTGDISPSQITANQDNYNPTNLATSSVLRLTSDASRDITGISGGADGRILILLNVGSNNIVLKDDVTSTAANRFQLNGDLTLLPNMGVILIYDSTDSRWRVASVIMPTPVTVAMGGTGAITLTDTGVLIGNGTGAVAVTSAGVDGQVLKANASSSDPSFQDDIATITFIIDGGGSAITTGIKGDLEIPFDCTILQSTLLADQSGSIVIDIWKDTYANYPPTVADTITASAKPTISSATKAQDATLTGWTTTITAGQTLRFNVDSITTITRVTLSLKVKKT